MCTMIILESSCLDIRMILKKVSFCEDSSNEHKYFTFIPHHTIVAGYYGFTLDIRLSVCPSVSRPSVFRFWMITWVNLSGFSPNLVCALILSRSGLGLLMGKFRQMLTELSARDTENKSWYFIWIVCLADDSHEISRLVFFEKLKK